MSDAAFEILGLAAAVLCGDGLEVTKSSLETLVNASGNKVEGFYYQLFCSALKGKDMQKLVLEQVWLGGGGGAGGAGGEEDAGEGEEAKVEEVEDSVESTD